MDRWLKPRPPVVTPLPALAPRDDWPVLVATGRDRAYVPKMAASAWLQVNQRRRYRRQWLRDLLAALPKGLVLGTLAFGIVFGVVPNWTALLADWHWALVLSGFVGLTILAGFEGALVLAAAATLWLSRATLAASLWLLLAYLAGGVLARAIYEIWPETLDRRI